VSLASGLPSDSTEVSVYHTHNVYVYVLYTGSGKWLTRSLDSSCKENWESLVRRRFLISKVTSNFLTERY